MDEYEIITAKGEKKVKELSEKAVNMLRRNPDIQEIRRNPETEAFTDDGMPTWPGVKEKGVEIYWLEPEGGYGSLYTTGRKKMNGWAYQIAFDKPNRATYTSGPDFGKPIRVFRKDGDDFIELGLAAEQAKRIEQISVDIEVEDVDYYAISAIGIGNWCMNDLMFNFDFSNNLIKAMGNNATTEELENNALVKPYNKLNPTRADDDFYRGLQAAREDLTAGMFSYEDEPNNAGILDRSGRFRKDIIEDELRRGSDNFWMKTDKIIALDALGEDKIKRIERQFVNSRKNEIAYQDNVGQDESIVGWVLNNGDRCYFGNEEIYANPTGDNPIFDVLTHFTDIDSINNAGIDVVDYEKNEERIFKEGAILSALFREGIGYQLETRNRQLKTALVLDGDNVVGMKDNFFADKDTPAGKTSNKIDTILSQIGQAISMVEMPLTFPIDLTKETAKYVEKGAADFWPSIIERADKINCSNCRFAKGDSCTILSGENSIKRADSICGVFTPTPEFLYHRSEGLVDITIEPQPKRTEIIELAAMFLQNKDIIEMKMKWLNQQFTAGKAFLADAIPTSIDLENGRRILSRANELSDYTTKRRDKLIELSNRTIVDSLNALLGLTSGNPQALLSKYGEDTYKVMKSGRNKNPNKKTKVVGARKVKTVIMDSRDDMTIDVKKKRTEEPQPVNMANAVCKNGMLCSQISGKGLTIYRKKYVESDFTYMQYNRSPETVFGAFDISQERFPKGALPIDGVQGVELENGETLLCGQVERPVVFKTHGDRIKQAFKVFTDVIKFNDPTSAKILFSTFLIKDGAVILKGVAGTGKTTMLEAITMMLANDIDYVECAKNDVHPDGVFSASNTLEFLKDPAYGSVGIAKHNQEKQPDEIYYYSRISEDTYTREDYLQWLSAKASAAQDNRRNPYQSGFIDEAKRSDGHQAKTDKWRIPVQSTETEFDPKAQPIVTHFVKFHNEGNRMNTKVADVTLGMLAENEVEYKGVTFPSPSDGAGGITLLDYNPHIDWLPNRELDRALLDRFQCSIFIPALDLGNKIELLGSSNRGDPKDRVQAAINNYVDIEMGNEVGGSYLNPLTKEELRECQKDVKAVTLSEKTSFMVACFANAFSMSFLKYPASQTNDGFYEEITPIQLTGNPISGEIGAKILGGKGEKPDNNQKNQALMPFLDASIENFGFAPPDDDNTDDFFSNKGVLSEPMLRDMFGSNCLNGNEKGGFIERMNQNYRPLGFRATQSLKKVAQAYTWLEAVLEDRDTSEGLLVTTSTLKEVIPFVFGHRLNIGLGNDIKNHYLNAEDWIKNDVIDRYYRIMETNWSSLYDNIYKVLFGYPKDPSDPSGGYFKGLAFTAVSEDKGQQAINQARFYEAYTNLGTGIAGGFSDPEVKFYQTVLGDPIGAMIYQNAYRMAKAICEQPAVWNPSENNFVLGANDTNWLYDNEGDPIGVFED